MPNPSDLRFTCARCGRTFPVDGPGGRPFERLGGKTVCSDCAAKRFRRHIDLDAPDAPDAVSWTGGCKYGARQTNP